METFSHLELSLEKSQLFREKTVLCEKICSGDNNVIIAVTSSNLIEFICG
jgi:hypothetical protein